MSISFTDYMVALRSSSLPGPVRSIALWIASRCSNGWPVTRETVAEDSGFSRSTVTRSIAELCEKGWLVPTRNRRLGNSYELSIPKPLSAHSEPTVGSERAYKKAQSEPTYIRTIQEQQEHPRARARTLAREGDAATIKHSNLNQGLLARWVRELVKVPEAKEEILKLSFQKSPGEVYQAMFVTSLYTSEALFERFRPWFVRLQSEGRL